MSHTIPHRVMICNNRYTHVNDVRTESTLIFPKLHSFWTHKTLKKISRTKQKFDQHILFYRLATSREHFFRHWIKSSCRGDKWTRKNWDFLPLFHLGSKLASMCFPNYCLYRRTEFCRYGCTYQEYMFYS